MLGRKLISVGALVGVVAVVRISVSLRRAFSANPHELSSVLTRFGYSSPPSEAELFVIGYQYALLRRSFPELDGTSVQRGQNALLLWFILLFAGVLIGLAGLVVEASELNAARI
jgi:hypothetical protein